AYPHQARSIESVLHPAGALAMAPLLFAPFLFTSPPSSTSLTNYGLPVAPQPTSFPASYPLFLLHSQLLFSYPVSPCRSAPPSSSSLHVLPS
uniref:Uncharacterized protein n=1 Tax=Aegilops tauschii subsp. strangulata TaxID=200361 RepID=A0A453PDK8_AEGTS